eukprot:2764961-Pleurochrysis_carterae.AAC.1
MVVAFVVLVALALALAVLAAVAAAVAVAAVVWRRGLQRLIVRVRRRDRCDSGRRAVGSGVRRQLRRL